MIAAGVFVALIFAVSLLGTPLVMWLYRRRVVALMSARDDAERADTDAPGAAAVPAAAAPARPAADPATLVAEADRRSRQLRGVLVAACAVYSVLAGLLMTLSPDLVISETRVAAPKTAAQLLVTGVADALMVGALCMPIVLIGIAHPRFARTYWRRFAPLLVATAMLRFAVNAEEAEGATLGTLFLALVFGGVFVVLFWLAVARRHARQVGPVLSVLLGTVFAGLAAAGVAMELTSRCLLGDEAPIGPGLLGLLTVLALFVGSFWLTMRMVRALGRLYERKALSDAQLQTGAWFMTLTALVALGVLSADPLAAGPWLGLLLGVVVAALLTYVFGLRRLAPWPHPQGLLLLRVFAQDERGERLLDETAFRWRAIGPIHMIGGPDMAQQTLDPHELLLFIRGRAREQFVTTREQLAQRLQQLDERPDPDGRYRINELFCFANVWQAGVQALLAHCPAVLLDLRGFSAARLGTAFEIGLLAREGALARTVCLVDAKTDRAAVAQTIAASGGGALDEAQVLHTDSGLDARRLFAALATAAARGSGPAV